ncbi:hypothetical protein BDZ89DRAFT_973609, partial [Hymenopellis radicata]
FIRLCVDLRNDILLVQPHTHDPAVAPAYLSPCLIDFLSSACSISQPEADSLWSALREMVWEVDGDPLLQSIRDADSYERLFQSHGHTVPFHSIRRTV